MKERQWNLSKVYPSADSSQFNDDIKKLEKMIKELTADISDCNVSFDQVIARYNDICDLEETLGTFASCHVSVNTTDKVAVGALNKVEGLAMIFAVLQSKFTSFVATHKEEAHAFVEKNPDYSFVISEIQEDATHLMSSEMEELAADLMRSGSDAFSRLQEAISSSASADFNGEKKTVIELRALATDKDRKVRKAAYEAELAVWKEHEIAFAYSLNSVKGTCLSLENRRFWPSSISRSCSGARISEKTLNALITTLENSLGMFRSYFATKAKLLGIKKLAFYDLFAPVGKADLSFDLEQARELVSSNYAKFNPKMGEFALNAFDNGWIDPCPRKGKTGGAYDCYLPKIKESRVMANFDGTYDGVSTFAHELGHAWHDHVVSDKPALLRRYPMTLAETASIFSEFIVFKGCVEKADDVQKISLIEQFIQGASQVCVDILCRFYFEREVFEKRKAGELMPDELCQIMLDCQKKTYGCGLDENFLHPYMWAVKSHYYSTDFSFYNYPYAFGQLFALGLYSRNLDCNKYNELLSYTGQLSAQDVAEKAGIDIENPAFWQQGIDIIASYEKQLEDLTEKYV